MLKIIVSGGGTAGHINPAISVVKALEQELGRDNVEALFVGAEGKMEMSLVPKSGYNIVGLPVRGFIRSLSFKNINIAYNMVRAIFKAKKIIKEFKPDVVMGFGGYASVPVLYASRKVKVLRYVWEGNSFAGAANHMVGKWAKKAFVSYDSTARFFPLSTVVVSGNPISSRFLSLKAKSEEALSAFGVSPHQKVVFVTGGSLGARKLNDSVVAYIDVLKERKDIFIIWQTGSYYFEEMKNVVGECPDNIWIGSYISNMEHAYSAADLVVCRSGASTVTEVASGGLAVVFVPSSSVTDDHQTKNAAELVASGAALKLTDAECVERLVPYALELLKDGQKLAEMRANIVNFIKTDAAKVIAKEILRDVEN